MELLKKGLVIVMTEKQNRGKILKMVNGNVEDVTINSFFDTKLENNFNSEISSRVIKTYSDAQKYFCNSLMFQQMQKTTTETAFPRFIFYF